mmetsp:Transcript_7611/g.22599  ORF Transcript_7611/g.22599 Transcript_7611/m.22599 type:complete len:407 (-) Transcript_7611:201-1421(-)
MPRDDDRRRRHGGGGGRGGRRDDEDDEEVEESGIQAQLPTRLQLGVLVGTALVLTLVADFTSSTCPVTSAYLSYARIDFSIMENVTVQQQSYEEGLSFELPEQMMFLAACATAAFGVCALAAGARVADDIFAMVFAVGTGTVMVGWLAPLLLASEHLEVELVTTWGTTAWWGNRTADPVVHGAEYKFPLDLTCGGSLYLTLLVIGLAMLLSRLMLPVALAATGLLSGVTAVRLLANFFPQLLVHAPRQEVLWSCGQQCVVPLSLTVYAPESLLPDGFGAEVYLGYPVQWFWYLAAPFAIAQAALLLFRGSERALIVTTALLGSFASLKGVAMLGEYYRGEYLVEAFETDTARGAPRAGLLSGVFQVVLFVAGIAVQYAVFPPDGMREARARDKARRQSRYLELNDN